MRHDCALPCGRRPEPVVERFDRRPSAFPCCACRRGACWTRRCADYCAGCRRRSLAAALATARSAHLPTVQSTATCCRRRDCHRGAALRAHATALGCDLPRPVRLPGRRGPGVDLIGADFCLSHGLVPIGRHGGAMLIAVARPAAAAGRRTPRLERMLGQRRFTFATAAAIEAALLGRPPHRADRLRRSAGPRTAKAAAAGPRPAWPVTGLAPPATAPAMLLAGRPRLVIAIADLITLVTCTASTAAEARRRARRPPRRAPPRRHLCLAPPPDLPRPPAISILVPLFREREIAGRLLSPARPADLSPRPRWRSAW